MMPGVRTTYRFGNVEIDQSNLQLTVDGTVRPLEPKAFRVLQFLVENPGRALTKDEILAAVWTDVAVSDNALTRSIAQLRKALGDDSKEPRFIETVPTVGYRFVAQPDSIPAPVPAPAASASRRPVLAGGLLVLFLIAGLFFYLRPVPAVVPAFRSHSQLTSSAGLDLNATLSPDGHLIAYASDRSGTFEIYVRPLEGDGRDTQVTTNGAQNLFPCFSPDGQSIAFSSSRTPGIYRVPTHGGSIERITSFGTQPVWSPDGKWIVFLSSYKPSQSTTDFYFANPDSTLWLVSASGGSPRELTPPTRLKGGQVFPSWSADSKEIRFINYAAHAPSLWSYGVETDSLHQRFALSYGITLGSATFSRDDRHLFFISAKLNGDIGIWHLGLDPSTLQPTGPPESIYKPGLGSPRDLSLSPDGSRIVYSAVLNHSQIRIQQLKNGLPDGPPTDIGKDTGYRYNMPSWAPDGSAILYTKLPIGRSAQSWMDRLDGTPPVPLGRSKSPQYFPQFIRDGKLIRYLTEAPDGSKEQIQDLSLIDGAITSHALQRPIIQPSFSTSGRWIVYHTQEPVPQLWKLDMLDGKATQLTFGDEFHGYGIMSPDDRWIELQTHSREGTRVWLLPADGGKLEPLIDTPGTWWTGGWSGDAKQLIVAGHTGNGWAIYSVSRETRKLTRLTPELPLRQYVRYPRWAPDGSRLAYEFNESKGNVFVAELGR